MLKFTKQLFIKNQNAFAFDSYDLTKELYILRKNNNFTQHTSYAFWGGEVVLYSYLATLLPWQETNILTFPIVLLISGNLIYGLGSITGLMLQDWCQPLLNKFSIFKRIKNSTEVTKEKLMTLCEDEHFQFSLLSHLEKVKNSLHKFTFDDHKEDKRKNHLIFDMYMIIDNLKYYFAQRDYEKAVKYFMEYETIHTIEKVLAIQGKLILKGKNVKEQRKAAQLKTHNLDNYEQSLRNFTTQSRNTLPEVELENEIALKKYL